MTAIDPVKLACSRESRVAFLGVAGLVGLFGAVNRGLGKFSRYALGVLDVPGRRLIMKLGAQGLRESRPGPRTRRQSLDSLFELGDLRRAGAAVSDAAGEGQDRGCGADEEAAAAGPCDRAAAQRAGSGKSARSPAKTAHAGAFENYSLIFKLTGSAPLAPAGRGAISGKPGFYALLRNRGWPERWRTVGAQKPAAGDAGAAILILFLRLGGTIRIMTKSLTEVQRHNAERQLFGARRALAHLVEMYDNGQWRLYYKKEEAFAEAVRNARQAVEHWTSVVNKCDDAAPAR